MAEVVAELSQLARQSPHLNQRSGVSVRLTIANYETLVANATRRALRNGESEAVPRVSDLQALVSSTQGKVEIESLEEGREEDPEPSWCRPPSSPCSAAGPDLEDPRAVVGAFTPRRWSTPVTTCRPRPMPRSWPNCRPCRPRCWPSPAGSRTPGWWPARSSSSSRACISPSGSTRRRPAPGHLSGSRMTWRFDYRRWDGTQDSLFDDDRLGLVRS
jgi:hypothetical protein